VVEGETTVTGKFERSRVAAYDVVIVGGGNLGLWTAYTLATQGFGRIAVCERGWAGGGATSRSAGVVRQQGGSETAIKLGKLSRELYVRIGKDLGLDSGFTETGYYIVAETEEEKEGFLRLVELRREAGVENEWVEPEEGKRRFPDLNMGSVCRSYLHPGRWVRASTHSSAQRNLRSDEFGSGGPLRDVRGLEHRTDRWPLRY
jgi:glycine/D-amino acid oxidase-like deaminating enzyme